MDSLLNFHDGFVDGLCTFKYETRIFLRTVTSDKFTLVLEGVEAFLATNVRQGNIILTLEFIESKDIEPKDIRNLYQYSEEHMKTFIFDDWVKKAKQKNLEMLRISPSYGCDLSAVCKRHEFITGHSVGNAGGK